VILLVHGWGFDARIWDAVAVHLKGLPLRRLDLGFFGAQETHLPDAPFLGVGHSLGFSWLLRYARPRLSGLMGVNSFPRFTADVDFPAGIAPRLLARMQARFLQDPGAVLGDFQRRAALPAAFFDVPCPANADAARLAQGLGWLADWDVRPALAALRKPLRLLAGRADAIVPAAMTDAAYAGYPVTWVEDGGHLLPLTASEAVAATIAGLWADICAAGSL